MEQTRRSIESQVLERAATDAQFRDQLKQDPRGTVARDLGVQVPSEITLEVVEETPTQVYLVLPATPARRGQELTGQELESVAGGWSGGETDCGTCGHTCKPTCQPGDPDC